MSRVDGWLLALPGRGRKCRWVVSVVDFVRRSPSVARHFWGLLVRLEVGQHREAVASLGELV